MLIYSRPVSIKAEVSHSSGALHGVQETEQEPGDADPLREQPAGLAGARQLSVPLQPGKFHAQLLQQSAICELYIRLLCQFNPAAVLPFLQGHDAYRVEVNTATSSCFVFTLCDLERAFRLQMNICRRSALLYLSVSTRFRATSLNDRSQGEPRGQTLHGSPPHISACSSKLTASECGISRVCGSSKS